MHIERDLDKISEEITQEKFEEINVEVNDFRYLSVKYKETLSINQEIMQSSNDLIVKLSQKLNLME